MTQTDNEMSAPMRGSQVSWEERDPRWFIARRHGKPVSAFRFESEAVHRKRSWGDRLRMIGMWSAWVPGDDGARLLTWPDGTPIEQMQAELIAADCRLH